MKNNLIKTVILLFAVTFVTLQSCEKKAIVPGDETGIVKNNVVNADKKAELLTSKDIKWILSNDDKEDMNVDKNSYYLGIALTELVKNKSILSDIETAVRKSNLDFYAFDNLVLQKSNSINVINNKLSSTDFSALNSEKEKLDYVTVSDNFRYKNMKYRPVINLMNEKTADFSLPVIVSPGIEVKDNPEKGIENAIIAWKLNDKNEWEEFILNENEASKMKNPIFVVSFNTVEDIDFNNNPKFNKIETTEKEINKEVKGGISAYSGYFKINYAYERSGKSEFYVTYQTMSPNGNVTPNPQNRVKIAEVKKKNIGKKLYSYKFVAYDRTNYKTIFNTWERDGYASQKKLGSFPGGWMVGRMKYSNEWYAFNPNTNNQNNLWTFPFNTGKYRDSKGYIEIKGTWLN